MAKGKRNRNDCCSCLSGCLVGTVTVVILGALLCGGLIFVLNRNSPKPPLQNFTPSQSLANNFDAKIDTSERSANNIGSFQLSITQFEASSWLNLNTPVIKDRDARLQNAQVAFQNGEAIFYVEFDAWGIRNIAAEFILKFTVDSQGKLQASVTSADIGGISVPESWREDINAEAGRILDEQLSEIDPTYRICTLSVNDGRFTLNGTINGRGC